MELTLCNVICKLWIDTGEILQRYRDNEQINKIVLALCGSNLATELLDEIGVQVFLNSESSRSFQTLISTDD